MVGGWLCWFQPEIVAPNFYVLTYVILLCLASLKSRDDEKALSAPLRAFGIGAFLLGALFVLVSLLLSWTFNTESYMQPVPCIGRSHRDFWGVTDANKPRDLWISGLISWVLTCGNTLRSTL